MNQVATASKAVEYRPLSPLGAEIVGVDLKRVDDETMKSIKDVLRERKVILFRNQKLEDEDFIRFGKMFGYELETHKLLKTQLMIFTNRLDKDRKALGLADGGQFWHTDGSHHEKLHKCTMLYSLEIPYDDKGEPLGDTLFSDTTRVYDELPDDLRKKVDSMQAVFSFAASYEKRKSVNENAVSAKEQIEKAAIRHPVAMPHPETGKRSIIVGENYVTKLEGVPEAEGNAIYDQLLELIKSDRYVYRHKWKVGDVIVWDNGSTQHCAVPDYKAPNWRLMKRLVATAKPASN